MSAGPPPFTAKPCRRRRSLQGAVFDQSANALPPALQKRFGLAPISAFELQGIIAQVRKRVPSFLQLASCALLLALLLHGFLELSTMLLSKVARISAATAASPRVLSRTCFASVCMTWLTMLVNDAAIAPPKPLKTSLRMSQ